MTLLGHGCEGVDMPYQLAEDERVCSECRRIVHILDCDTCGAATGFMFCTRCNAEIDIHTGQKAKP